MDAYKEIVQEAVARGWRVVNARRHPKLVSPDGKRRISISRTPSARNAVWALRARLRREGILER